jgi:hypothetical protein
MAKLMDSLKDKVKEKLSQEFSSLERKFPKEVREELKAKVITNLKETRVEVENRARVFAEKSRENPIVLKYLRPLVGSERTQEVLSNLETKVSSAAPVVRRIQSLRQQFLDLTAPQVKNTETAEAADETTPKKKKTKSRTEKTQDE